MGVSVSYRSDRKKWVVRETANGKRYFKSFGGNKEGERQAREYAAKRIVEINDARFNGEIMGRKEKRTFLEGVAKWIDEYNVASQIKHINPVIKYMGDKVLLDQGCVDKAREMARDCVKQGLAQSTINNRLQVVKRVLSLAYIEWEWLDRPLAEKIRKKTPKNERHIYLTVPQIGQLMRSFDDQYAIERVITGLAAITGLRKGELLKIDKRNVMPGRIVLRPDQTKNGRLRAVPIPDDAMPWLMELPFQTTEHRLRWAFEKARKKAGMTHVRFHDLRHTYASLLAQQGESLTTVRDILGHSSLAVTSRYTHLFDSRLDKVKDELPKLFGNQSATKADIEAKQEGDIEL